MTTPDPRGVTPKLKAGCAWINRPHRSLSFLTSDSNIPILNPRNSHHFILLAKYRPQITFIKAETAWDWAAWHARERCHQTSQQQNQAPEYTVPSSSDTEKDESRPSTLQSPVKSTANLFSPRPGQPGWPQLHTALRCITRQQPRGKVSNEELYASLRKPSAVDILGANWRDQHKQTQNKLLQKASFRSILQRPVPNEAVSSRISSARSMTHSVASSALFLRSSLNSLPTLTSQHRSPNVVTYTPLDKQPVKDSLASDWKEHHKKRQERLLQQKKQRERTQEIVQSARSVAVAAVSVIRQSSARAIDPGVVYDIELPPPAMASQISLAKTFVRTKSISPRRQGTMEISKGSRRSRQRERPPSDRGGKHGEEFLEAQIGILKDWLRTQLPSRSDTGRNEFYWHMLLLRWFLSLLKLMCYIHIRSAGSDRDEGSDWATFMSADGP